MKIDSKDKKIKDILTDREYTIPEYQRDYSWEINEEISIFWDDFVYFLKNNDSDFFIGPMVFIGNNGIDSSELEVVDGQQRLITLSILISVLVVFFRELGHASLADGLMKHLIFKDLRMKDCEIIKTEEPHPFYQKVVFNFDRITKPNKNKKSENRIDKTRKYFEKQINEELDKCKKPKEKVEYLEKIRDHLLNIDIVIIISNKEADAFTIFETINTRGKNLSSLDLLKNYIFREFDKKVGIDEPKKTWSSIQDNISKEADKFFNRFWASWVFKVTESKLFRRFSFYMKSQDCIFKDTNQLFDKITISSLTYRKILSPSLEDWKANNNLAAYYTLKHLVGHFNAKVPIPFLLALIEEFDRGKIKRGLFLATLKSLENFHFIFTHIVSPRASGLDGKYSKFAIKLRKESDKANVIKDLMSDLKGKLPSRQEYNEKFSLLNYIDDKETIKYILLRLEREERDEQLVDLEDNSIEHMYPKKFELKNKNSIGNLFLLETLLNSKKGNYKPFDKIKKETVVEFLKRETSYKTTKTELESIIIHSKWDTREIDDRTQELSEKTYKLFSKIGT